MQNDDNNTNIMALANEVYHFVNERDWRQFHTPKNLAAAIAIEAGELQELFLWREDDARLYDDKLQRIREELADIIIYCLALSNEAGIDVTKAVLDKLKKNAEKYPADKWKGRAW